MSMADIFADPHYRAREMIIDVPVAGLGTLPQPGVVPKLSLTPGRVTHAGGALGSHTERDPLAPARHERRPRSLSCARIASSSGSRLPARHAPRPSAVVAQPS